MAAIQDAPLRLEPGASARRGFFGWFEERPPGRIVARRPGVRRSGARSAEAKEAHRARRVRQAIATAPTLFSARPILASLDLTDSEVADLFGKDLRNVERENGCTLSFFTGANRHVVLKAKELKVLRPHGHIIRSGGHLVPDEASLTSTTWMAGVFNSLVTQGPRQHQPRAVDHAQLP